MPAYKKATGPQSVVYLTVYHGNKLPPFYIGSTYLERHEKGYCGSVTSKKYGVQWRAELKNHPELFTSKILRLLPTRKAALELETRLQLKLGVVKNPLYINESVAQRKFIRGSEVSKETKRLLSNAGKNQSSAQKENTGLLARLRNRRIWTIRDPHGSIIVSKNLVQTAEQHNLNVKVLHTSMKKIDHQNMVNARDGNC